MKRFKLFLNAKKEQQWLNDMLQKGWVLQHISSFHVYTFKKTANIDQIICLDCQSFSSKQKFEEYKAFHEELGWIHLSCSRYTSLQFWLNPSSKDDSLFSDSDSEKKYLQRLTKNHGYTAFFFLLFSIMIYDNDKQFTSPTAAFYTPGIWDLKGTDFIMSFLIEFPFALVRFSSIWVSLGFGVAFLITYLKYKQEEEKYI